MDSMGGADGSKVDRLLPYLKRVRSLMGWSLYLLSFGVIAGSVCCMLCAVTMLSQCDGLIVLAGCLCALCGLLVAIGVVGLVLLVPVWLAIVFFGYTRYSLRTMVIWVWLLAGLVALIVTGNHGVTLIAIPFLHVAILLLAIHVACNDPLGDHDKKVLAEPRPLWNPSRKQNTAGGGRSVE